jgi:hypothetical protein
MAKLKKIGTYKFSSKEGKQTAGKDLHPKTTNKKMLKGIKNTGGYRRKKN